MRSDEELIRTAETLADEAAVDWDTARTLGGAARQLETIESIMAAHRALGAEARTEPRQWGTLKILERLGQGLDATVYRAWDPALEREVALKLLHPERTSIAPAAVVDEARRLARVRHANVVAVHGADRRDGRVGLWTDLLAGQTLEQVLRHHGPLGANEAAVVGLDLCRALAAVHAAGLVHRDVKTANVMREAGGRIVLFDFGSARGSRPRGAVDGEPVSGTPLFAAPEVLLGAEPDARSDLYSLGVVLYRLVSGAYPVEARDLEELRARHGVGARVALRDRRPDLPSVFVGVVERALAPRPEERFQTAGELERALAETIRPRRRLVLAGLAAVLVVATLAVVWSAAVTVSFDADAELYRQRGAEVERLGDGGRVELGDALYLEIEGSRPMHVYALDEDAHGRLHVLFPAPGLDATNPLAPRRRHVLPGTIDGRPFQWQVDSAGERETILVVASIEAVPELEQLIVQLDAASSDRALGTHVRGIGGLTPSSPMPSSGGVLDELALRRGRREGIVVWEYRLSNPGSY